MSKMPENQDLKIRIMESYLGYLSPIVGENTELANKLTTGLDEILIKELPTNTVLTEETSRIQQQEQPDYDSTLGPVIENGKQYTAQQVLDMSVGEFKKTHGQSMTQQIGDTRMGVEGYFNLFTRAYNKLKGLPPKDTLTIKDILAIPSNEYLTTRGIRETRVDRFNKYFQNNYRLSLGMK